VTPSRALPTRSVAKPWGRDALPAPFPPNAERIGEIWFEPPPELPGLLVKYLFTSENLSVQVHPSDAQAPAGSSGKDECWLIVSAEPGARLALGLKQASDRETVRAAALDGSIESLLEWYPVRAGDFFYLPAGTIHAIGSGLSLIEVQQNSDVTYRLYDYGRPRELHLDEALAVATLGPHEPAMRRHLPETGTLSLVVGPHFRLDRIEGQPCPELTARYADRPLLVIPVDAPVSLDGPVIEPGGCGFANSLEALSLPDSGRALIAQPL
jgi:mannose-6-phosphate isomerase